MNALREGEVLSGQTLTQEEKDDFHNRFLAYGKELARKNNTTYFDGFSNEDNASHYVNSLRMSVIDPAMHGGWPYKHRGRRKSLSIIKKKLEKDHNAALMAAAIIPAIDNNQTQYAIDTYRKLYKKNEHWAKYILITVRTYSAKNMEAHFFLSGVSESGQKEDDNKSLKATDKSAP